VGKDLWQAQFQRCHRKCIIVDAALLEMLSIAGTVERRGKREMENRLTNRYPILRNSFLTGGTDRQF